MENTPLELYIERTPGSFGVRIYFIRHSGDTIHITARQKETGEIIGRSIPRGVYAPDALKDVDPILETDERLFREMLQAFSKEAMGQGIETQQSYIKGKLEATEHHLTRTEKLIDFLLPVLKS